MCNLRLREIFIFFIQKSLSCKDTAGNQRTSRQLLLVHLGRSVHQQSSSGIEAVEGAQASPAPTPERPSSRSAAAQS